MAQGKPARRLRDAYPEPWTGHGRTVAELRRGLSLAWRLGALGRACSWGRLFPGACGGPGTGGVPGAGGVPGMRERADWLRSLLAEPLV
ncbi:hypothetical protein [Streptomyces sp. NRRL F-4489]|uniref:hypothetical protein n=1 Tax=Streptomyces sp. NRRL F-4489 TaxID=1609095 RepID=UPI000AB52DA3